MFSKVDAVTENGSTKIKTSGDVSIVKLLTAPVVIPVKFLWYLVSQPIKMLLSSSAGKEKGLTTSWKKATPSYKFDTFLDIGDHTRDEYLSKLKYIGKMMKDKVPEKILKDIPKEDIDKGQVNISKYTYAKLLKYKDDINPKDGIKPNAGPGLQ
jgi:hypothetical protein